MAPFPGAVIFDFDGILMNSEPLHFGSLRQVLREYEIDITEPEYYLTMLGLSDYDTFKFVFGKHERSISEELLHQLMDRKSSIMMSLISRRQFEPLPHVQEFVIGLSRNYPLGICSGGRRREIEAMLLATELHRHFGVIVSADDCPIGKPDPAGYMMAMTQLAEAGGSRLTPADCLVVEDSPGVVRAMRRAGFRVMAVANSVGRDMLEGADWIVDSLEPRQITKLIPQLKVGHSGSTAAMRWT
jgi:HAD superfamily hydrolase (TIGR01509 family)